MVVGRACIPSDTAMDNDLRADFRLWLEQDRVHVTADRHAACAGLQRLGAADFSAIMGHGGIVRHVLRFERPHSLAAFCEGAA